MSRMVRPGPARVLAVGLVLLVLVLVQVTVLARLSPGAAAPDLVIVAVLALGYAHGPIVGGLAGAWAGVLLDLVPPAAGPLGGWALVLGLVGAAVGRIAATLRPGPFGALALIALGTGAAVLARGAVLWFAGATPGWSAVAAAIASAGWALLLAPIGLLAFARDPARASAPARTVPHEVAR